MAVTYLEMVNRLCRKVNEVELSLLNFNEARGFYSLAKDAVNRALRDIHDEEDFWSFNYAERTQLITPTSNRYSIPANAKVIDFDSFRIGTNCSITTDPSADWTTLAEWSTTENFTNQAAFLLATNLSTTTKWLRPLNYDEYLKKYSQNEFSVSNKNEPQYVVKTPTNYFIIHPTPAQNYPLFFNYHVVADDLVNSDDTLSVPDRYAQVVFAGALRDVYDFHEDDQKAVKYEELFRDKLKEMRRREVNLYDYVRSGMMRVNNY